MNRNTVPFDERPPTVASGVRIGTPAMTMRGFDEDDFRETGRIICDALTDAPDLDGAARPRRRALREAAALSGLPRLHDVRRVMAVGRNASRSSSIRSSSTSSRYLRDKDTPTVHFRKLANEITLLLTYEATKDLPTEDYEIETPLETDDGAAHLGQEGRRLPGAARGRRHARRRALARLERARRLHRHVPRRGDARSRCSTTRSSRPT